MSPTEDADVIAAIGSPLGWMVRASLPGEVRLVAGRFRSEGDVRVMAAHSVLVALERSEGGLSAMAVADDAGMHPQSVDRALADLCAAGRVVRVLDTYIPIMRDGDK